MNSVFDWTKLESDLPWLQPSTILLTIAGSHAYGLETDGSDYDWRGVCIPPPAYFTGFLHRFEQADKFDGVDCAIFDIRKFFALAADANPNILDILWTEPEDLPVCSSFGMALRAMREQFLSRKIRETFSGYAFRQLRRIKTHRKWLLDPPTKKPERAEFDLPETALLSADMMGAIEASGADKFSDNVMATYQKERSYHNALVRWQQYQNWKRTRNPSRAKLEAEFGYDCKHAMHLVRLLRMGAEILETGEVIVKRPDREELLEIRGGAWSYDRIVGYAEEMDAKLTELEKTSSLPHSPNRSLLDYSCQELVMQFHRWPR